MNEKTRKISEVHPAEYWLRWAVFSLLQDGKHMPVPRSRALLQLPFIKQPHTMVFQSPWLCWLLLPAVKCRQIFGSRHKRYFIIAIIASDFSHFFNPYIYIVNTSFWQLWFDSWALDIRFLSHEFSLNPVDVISFLLKKMEYHKENSVPNKKLFDYCHCSKSLSIFFSNSQ